MVYFIVCGFAAAIFLLACVYEKDGQDSDVKKLKHGRASKVEFGGHSYVVWQQNITDCIIHDPDCNCQKKEG